MNTRLKLAWVLSLLVTAVASFGLVGTGTSASFSDTVTVTHRITTAQVRLRIVEVDGRRLEPATQFRLSDVVRTSDADVTRVVTLRNDGTTDITSLFLTTTPGHDDSRALARALSVGVRVSGAQTATEHERTLAGWEDAARELGLPGALAPGETVTVTMHTTGTPASLGDRATVEPTYAFTAYADSAGT